MTHGTSLDLDARPVKLHGNRVAGALMHLAGWRVNFNGLPAKQGVLIVYPHTSNWDFVMGVLAKWTMGLPVTFWGKDSLFRMPLFGRWLRWVGGVPVDRSNPKGAVAQMVARLQRARERDEFMWLALAPEGTRTYREHWRSGFYQVALQADLPLGLAYFDYRDKRVGVDSFLRLSGDPARDMAEIERRLGHHQGHNPHLAAPIRLP